MALTQSKVKTHLRSFVVFASLGLLIAACSGDSDQPAEPVAADTDTAGRDGRTHRRPNVHCRADIDGCANRRSDGDRRAVRSAYAGTGGC